MKSLKNKLFSFKHSFSKYCVGNSFHIENRKIRQKDTNNFVILISSIFAFFFYGIFRSFNTFFKDIGGMFTFPFSGSVGGIIVIVITALVLAFAIVGSIIIMKRKYVCISDAIGMIGLLFAIYFFIYEIKAFGIKNDNWLIWLIMDIPMFFLLFSLGVRAFRFFLKFFKSDTIVLSRREEDFEFFKNRNKKFFYRVAMYLKDNWGQLLIILALIALVASVLYPLATLLIRSIRDWKSDYLDPFGMPKTFTFENYELMWEYLKGSFINSLVTAVSVTAGCVVMASMLAFAFIRFRFPFKNVLFYLIIGLMMIPGLLTLISRYQIVTSMFPKPSLWGIILPGMIGYVPGAFMLLFTFFRGLPHDLFEAAEVDGANDLQIYMRMVLPLSKPILSTIVISTFVGEWNDYLWAYLIVNGDDKLYTLPVYLNFLSDSLVESGQTSVIMAGYAISAIPLVLIFIVAGKQFVEGLTSGAFKM